MNELLQGLVLGLHLASIHVPANDHQNNFNPGVYVRTETGLTVGVYRNTIRRTSVYFGQAFTHDRFSLLVGAVNGYKLRKDPADCASLGFDPSVYNECYNISGATRHEWSPLVAASVALPVVGGVTPRLTYLPKLKGHEPENMIIRDKAKASHTFHLSLEKEF